MKERIVGAVVLVALVVLVVPVFLDGPPADSEIHTERVPLPGQDGQKTETVVLERQRSEPVPAHSASPAAAKKPQPDEIPQSGSKPEASVEVRAESLPPAEGTSVAADPAPSAERPPAAESPAAESPAGSQATATAPSGATAAAPAATGMFAVQLGSFSSKENAEKLAAELRRQGFAAFLSQLASGSGQLHRVRVGPQKDRQAAEAMAGRLAKAGHKGQVVAHP